jgi:hypothetical protein
MRLYLEIGHVVINSNTTNTTHSTYDKYNPIVLKSTTQQQARFYTHFRVWVMLIVKDPTVTEM